ncbi:MAG: DNRLRE domain-containing protein, partial [Bacteroidetes bacterium]|nr:DNRLRE domain-containing protein [Bacteroidota bacterium]
MKINEILRLTTLYVVLCTTVSLSAQTVTTLYPVQDAMIRAQFPDNNYGASTSITFGLEADFTEKAYDVRSLLQFDLTGIPYGAIVLEATLSLYGVNHESSSGSYLQPVGVNGDWYEDSVTWNNQPHAVETGQVYIAPASVPDQDYQLDIGFFVEQWLSGAQNNGMMFRRGAGLVRAPSLFRFASSDYSDNSKQPTLEITYVAPLELSYDVTRDEMTGLFDVTATVSGGIPPYSLFWEDGSTDAVRNGLESGCYLLEVSDDLGLYAVYEVVADNHWPVAWTDMEHTVVDGPRLISVANGDTASWMYGAASTNIIPAGSDGGMRYVFEDSEGSPPNRAIGLSSVNADANWTTIGYGFYFNYFITKNLPAFGPLPAPSAYIYESGVKVAGIEIKLVAGDVYEVVRAGSDIRYLLNGEIIHETAADAGTTLMADVSFMEPGIWFTGVEMTGMPINENWPNIIIDFAADTLFDASLNQEIFSTA